MFKILVSILFAAAISGTIYDFSLPSNNGQDIHFSDFAGKKILIVNTATQSDYEFQFEKLEQLYQLYKDSLVIVAIPSNSFEHEPGNDSTIKSYLDSNYAMSYILSAKQEVTGENQNSLYHWITSENDSTFQHTEILGDFQKYLIDRDGKLIGVFAPSVDPMSAEMTNAITGNFPDSTF